MFAEPRLRVVLCWHMHQPQYRDLLTGDYQLPWTYLHAVKDYVDMAAHLEAQPQARAVVNFAPILLEQVADYARQVDGFLRGGTPIGDPLLAALDMPALPVDRDRRTWLMRACLRANRPRLIDRFPPYRRLADLAPAFLEHPGSIQYLSEQYLADLLVWYHLAWLGETVRRTEPRVRALMDLGEGYTLHDRRVLLEVIGDLLGGVLQRYRALAERGQVELSVTPYAHPILPLLIDLETAREAMPQGRMPVAPGYPGGAERAAWHVRRGLEVFRHHFGLSPRGCWPAEGGVSDAALRLLEGLGFAWVASGENVLRNSLAVAGDPGGHELPLHRPYQLPDSRLACFFRDDGLSDLIGFTYADWHADDAVANLLGHLENIEATTRGSPDRVVSIIMDGENAWEYFPDNGYHFLSCLYRRLVEHPALELTTFSACLDAGIRPRRIGRLVGGSWVYGNFSTWIGDEGKNRGWDMLVDAKHAYDQALATGVQPAERQQALEAQLAVCEGSDWFWWFGDYNPAETVSDFERLYRLHLANLYQLLQREPPEYLSHSFTRGHGTPRMGGVMRTGGTPAGDQAPGSA